MYAINHCEMRNEIQAVMDSAGFSEAVVQRAGEIIQAALIGTAAKKSKSTKKSKTSRKSKRSSAGSAPELSGVELVARVLASRVLEKGAEKVAVDMDVDLDRLAELASDTHISSC